MRLRACEVPMGGRVVCLSDVHGNLSALDAVLAAAPVETADRVVVHGDIVSRGPCSDRVWARLEDVRDGRWVLSQGNHERYVHQHLDPARVATGIRARVHQPSRFTFDQLGRRVVEALAALPDGVRIVTPGLPEVQVVHASMGGDEAGIDPFTPDEEARLRTRGAGPVMVVGHLHRRLDFKVGPTRVVNAGSVGSSCDGVRRAGWVELEARPEGWRAELYRVPYDLERAEADYRASGFLEGGGPVAALIHREWQTATPTVRPWMRSELAAVLAGERSLEASVEAWLSVSSRR